MSAMNTEAPNSPAALAVLVELALEADRDVEEATDGDLEVALEVAAAIHLALDPEVEVDGLAEEVDGAVAEALQVLAQEVDLEGDAAGAAGVELVGVQRHLQRPRPDAGPAALHPHPADRVAEAIAVGQVGRRQDDVLPRRQLRIAAGSDQVEIIVDVGAPLDLLEVELLAVRADDHGGELHLLLQEVEAAGEGLLHHELGTVPDAVVDHDIVIIIIADRVEGGEAAGAAGAQEERQDRQGEDVARHGGDLSGRSRGHDAHPAGQRQRAFLGPDQLPGAGIAPQDSRRAMTASTFSARVTPSVWSTRAGASGAS